MIKRFEEWITQKKHLHEIKKPPMFNEGDIWWCAFGENVDIEVNGKGDVFTRPVFIYKKLSRNGFLGIPMTTQIRNGTWYVEISFAGTQQCANLAQCRVLASKRLFGRMGELDERDIQKIKNGFLKLYS